MTPINHPAIRAEIWAFDSQPAVAHLETTMNVLLLAA
jgi:hypothetical protein